MKGSEIAVNRPDAVAVTGGIEISDAPHLQVVALAGTGKTTTAVEGMKLIKGFTPSIMPSPQQLEIWKQLQLGRYGNIRFCAFNSSIAGELKERLAVVGLDKKGCEARTNHSLGLSAVTKAFGRLEASEWAVKDLISKVLGGNYQDLKAQPGVAAVMTAVEELVSLCKQNLTDPIPWNLDQLASHYDVEINGQKDRIFRLVPEILEQCKRPRGKISFDDMIWLPVVLGLPVFKVDLNIIDESQDLNRCQQDLIKRSGHRICFIGDPHQAIYGFAGADAESMARLEKELGASPRGCRTLPLTVTRRCSQAVVREAQRIVPEFEAHSDNPEGLISQARYPIRGKGNEAREIPWERSYCGIVRPGDMLLCRVNAPLVSQCFRFLARGAKANILGRKIGEGLVNLVKKSKAASIPQFLGWLEDWQTREVALESAKKYPSEQRMIALQDKYTCLVCFTQDCSSVEKLVEKISSIFTDNRDNPGILLSSIHKAKGLEARRVFLLEPEGATVPHPMAESPWQRRQEWNLRYVAQTRAREELIYVS